MSKGKNKPIKLKDLPSNESICAKIKEYRLQSEKSQADVAYLLKKSRTWIAQVEYGGIDPIYFYRSFVKLYGKERALDVYGEDWDLYTGERVALYYAYFKVNRKESCETLGVSYTALRYMLDHPEKYITKYKEGIDALFPKMREVDLSHYHLVGYNSYCYVRNATAIVLLNENTNFKHKDTPENYDELIDEAQMFVEFHDKCDHLPPGSYDIPASKMSFRGLPDD